MISFCVHFPLMLCETPNRSENQGRCDANARRPGESQRATWNVGGTGSVHSHIWFTMIHFGQFCLISIQKGKGKNWESHAETQVTKNGSWLLSLLSLIISRELSDRDLHQVGSGW